MSHYSRVIPVLLFLTVALWSLVALATVFITHSGNWPKDWPKELEPLRKEARTLTDHQDIYEISFTDRAVFERFWPILSQLKSKGAPLTLYKIGDPGSRGFTNQVPVVRIFAPPQGWAQEPKSGKRLNFGPPWPPSAFLPDGRLPEYVQAETVNGTMTLVPATPWKPGQPRRRFGEQRARVDLELVVDGNVIDLNRIPLPADTPVIDKRWSSDAQKSQTNK